MSRPVVRDTVASGDRSERRLAVTERDMRAFCDEGGDGENATSAILVGELSRARDGELGILTGTWTLSAGASLIPSGNSCTVTATQNTVTVVSCDGPLRYTIQCGTSTRSEISPGSGLDVDPSLADGVFFEIPTQPAKLTILNESDSDALITLEVVGGPENDTVCSAGMCWHMGDLQSVGPGGQECGWIRCWRP